MKIYSKSFEWLIEQQANYKSKLPKIQDGEAKELAKQGLAMIEAEIERREQQKKSQSQPIEKVEQLPDQEQQIERENKAAWYEGKREKAQEARGEFESTFQKARLMGTDEPSQLFKQSLGNIKTIKAPTIDREPEYINIELTDQKGEKYIRTYNRAQVKALCRKYFSNVHSAWVGGNRKLTNGFDNLVAYFLGWIEFDGSTPGLQDVLQDYFRYRKAKEGVEDSEAFKVAQELYGKIISVITKDK